MISSFLPAPSSSSIRIYFVVIFSGQASWSHLGSRVAQGQDPAFSVYDKEANPVSIPDWEHNLKILASYYTVKDPLSTQKPDAF